MSAKTVVTVTETSSEETEPEFWDTQQVAIFLGVATGTLRYWHWEGTGPPSYKLGRHRKYRPIEVRAWVNSCRADPKPRHERP